MRRILLVGLISTAIIAVLVISATKYQAQKSQVIEQETSDSLGNNSVLNIYLSPYSLEKNNYSGLSSEELTLINNVILLASQNITYTDEEKKSSTDTYKKFFPDDNNRVEDAPSMRANVLIGTKLCIANLVIQNNRPKAVLECSKNNTYPNNVEWLTDDIIAEAQIAPFYVTGSYYFDNTQETDKAQYYLRQILRHYNVGTEQWGKDYFRNTAGEDYLNMVNAATAKLETLN